MRNYRNVNLCLLLAAATFGPLGMAEETVQLPEMVVTATRTERDRVNTPQAVAVLGTHRIEQSNQATTTDLFRYIPSVYIQKSNLGGGSPFIRGLTGKQVLLLVDGVRTNNSFYRAGPHQYLNTIDPNIIERIEVVRGPTSVLYGSDALGGSINIITRRRKNFEEHQDLGGLFAGQYQSAADAGMLRGQVEANWGKLGAIAGATGKIFDDLNGGGDLGAQVPSAYDEANADLKLNYLLGDHHEFILAQQYTRQFDVPKTNEVVLGDRLKFNYEPQERELGYLEYRGKDVAIFDGAKVNLSYNRQREGEQIIDRATPFTETRELTDVETFGAALQLNNYLGDGHSLSYGSDFYRDHFDTRKRRFDLPSGRAATIAPGVPDGTFYQSWGWYLQDEASIGSRLDAIAGVRYSRFDTEGTLGNQRLSFETDAVVGNLNVLFRLSPELNLVGGVAWGFRAPNIEDFFGRVDFFNEIPNTNLKPEESVNQEIGLKYFSGRIAAEAYYFHSDYEGFIDRMTVGRQPNGNPILQRRNLRNAEIQGVETILEYRFNDHWRLETALAWTEGTDSDTEEPLRRIPPLNGNARLRYAHDPNLWTEFAVVWADHQKRLAAGDISDPRIGPDGTPGYVVFDLRAGYKLARQHEIIVGVENLADKKYKTHGSGIFNAGINAALTYRWRF